MATMKFGERLKELRQARGITQRTLADLLKMDTAYLSRTENGQTGYLPSRKTIEAIAIQMYLPLDESDELHILAGKIPSDIETALFANPKLIKLVRKRMAA